MTREEAEKLVMETGWNTTIIDVLAKLDVLKLTPAPKPADPVFAWNARRPVMVEISFSDGMMSGELTIYGLGCVIEWLRVGGFSIVKDK